MIINSFVRASDCDRKVSTWHSWQDVSAAVPSCIDLLTMTPVAYCEQAPNQDVPDEANSCQHKSQDCDGPVENEARREKDGLEHGAQTLFQRCCNLEIFFGGGQQCNPDPGRGSAIKDLYHLGIFFGAVVQQPNLVTVLPMYIWPTIVDVEDYMDVAMHMAILTWLFDWLLTSQFLPFAPPGALGSVMAWKISLMATSIYDVALKTSTGVEIHSTMCRASVATLVSIVTALRIGFLFGLFAFVYVDWVLPDCSLPWGKRLTSKTTVAETKRDHAEASKAQSTQKDVTPSKSNASSGIRQIRKEAATVGTAAAITMESLRHAAVVSARRRREQLVAGTGRTCPMALQCKCLGVKQTRRDSSYVVIPDEIQPNTDEAVFQWKVSAPGCPVMTGTIATKCCDAIGEKGAVGFPVGWFKQLGEGCREMAKEKYSLRHMQAIGTASAVQRYEDLLLTTHHKADAVLSCTLKPPIDDKPIKWDTKVEFEWKAEVVPAVETASITTRGDSALQRGVPLPDKWNAQLLATVLPAVAKETTEQMHARNPNLRPRCQALGVPKQVLLPTVASQREAGGSIVVKQSDGRSYQYVLCACVDDALWWCHRGYADDETEVFSSRNLQLLDLDRDVGAGAIIIKKQRFEGGCESKDPRALACEFPQAFAAVVALAQWKAEELSSHTQRRSFHLSSAVAGFEIHPWKWTSWEKQPSHQKIWFAWSWNARSPTGTASSDREERCLTTCRLDNLLQSNCRAPIPTQFSEAHLMQKLELSAQRETEETNAPCQYIGMKIGETFEPDPKKWCGDLKSGKSLAAVWFEFPGVLHGHACKEPLRVSALVCHLVGDNPRNVPNNPLRSSTSLALTFTVPFMQEVAKNVAANATYEGVTYEADRPDIKLEVPNGGQDIQREPVYWVLPGGRCVCKSLLAFTQLPPEELGEASTLETYEAAAEELDFFFLGLGPDAEVEDFREAPGSLSQRRWLDVDWRVPENEAIPCWWIVNISDQGSKPEAKPVLICRSLACLHIGLKQHRFATRLSLVQEHAKRQAGNSAAAAIIRAHEELWKEAGGPLPEQLEDPNAKTLQEARAAALHLQQRFEEGGDGGNADQQESCCIETSQARCLTEAVERLKMTRWDAIHRERFHVTPKPLFDEIAKQAENYLDRFAGHANRRQRRASKRSEASCPPAEAVDGNAFEVDVKKGEGDNICTASMEDVPGAPRDPQLDPDDFKRGRYRRKPYKLCEVASQARDVHIDQMRVLLEMHYDETHKHRWIEQRRQGLRCGRATRSKEKQIMRAVLDYHHSERTDLIKLPQEIKDIFQEPSNENDWQKLTEFRKVLLEFLEGATLVELPDAATAQALADTIRACEDNVAQGLLSADICHAGTSKVLIPRGAKIVLPSSFGNLGAKRAKRDHLAAYVEELVRPGANRRVKILMWPVSSDLAPPILDDLGKVLFGKQTLRVIACQWQPEELCQEELLDRMLLLLWRALFRKKSETWPLTIHFLCLWVR